MMSSVTEGKATIHVNNDTSSDVFYNPGKNRMIYNFEFDNSQILKTKERNL